jgi:hypothetical protein
MRADQIEIIKPSEDGVDAAHEFGVPHTAIKVTVTTTRPCSRAGCNRVTFF